MMMKVKRSIRRLSAAAMVLAMSATVLTATAFADNVGVGVDSLTIKTTIETDGKTYAPNTTFTYTIATADATTYDGTKVYAGVAGGAYFATGKNTITFSAADGTSNLTKSTTIFTGGSKFTKPGIYHYTVQQTAPDYDGLAQDTAARDLYVYVTYGTNTALQVSNVVLVKGTTKSDEWINDYGKHNGTIKQLTVQKVTEGNLANKTDPYEIKVTITSNQENTSSNQEKYLTNYTPKGEAAPISLSSGVTYTFQLANDQSVEIYGLSGTDKYTVDEDDKYATDDGYTVTGEVLTATAMAVDNVIADRQVTVTNKKETSTPTGVMMNAAPYVLMVAVAGGVAFFFLRRKHAE